MARTAEVKRDARIGEADAKRDAQIKEAIAEEERMAARLLNDAEIAKSKRDFELKKAAYDVEVQTKVRHGREAFVCDELTPSSGCRKQRPNWRTNSRLPRPSRGSRTSRCKSGWWRGRRRS